MRVCLFLCTSRKRGGEGGTDLLILNHDVGWKGEWLAPRSCRFTTGEMCSLTGHNLGLLLASPGHSTLRRHLHLMGLSCNPLRRRCGAEEETSIHILLEGEALALLRHVHLGSFFLDPEDIKSLCLGAFWNFNKGAGLP
jgi:hypothetical protein